MGKILDRLKNNQLPTNADKNVLDKIDAFATEVEAFANSIGGGVSCVRERGFTVSYGQEWRVVLYKLLPAGGGNTMNYSQILFRVYVPLIPFQSQPVRFDLDYEEMVLCGTLDEVEQELEKFAGLPQTAETIQYLANK